MHSTAGDPGWYINNEYQQWLATSAHLAGGKDIHSLSGWLGSEFGKLQEGDRQPSLACFRSTAPFTSPYSPTPLLR